MHLGRLQLFKDNGWCLGPSSRASHDRRSPAPRHRLPAMFNSPNIGNIITVHRTTPPQGSRECPEGWRLSGKRRHPTLSRADWLQATRPRTPAPKTFALTMPPADNVPQCKGFKWAWWFPPDPREASPRPPPRRTHHLLTGAPQPQRSSQGPRHLLRMCPMAVRPRRLRGVRVEPPNL